MGEDDKYLHCDKKKAVVKKQGDEMSPKSETFMLLCLSGMPVWGLWWNKRVEVLRGEKWVGASFTFKYSNKQT